MTVPVKVVKYKRKDRDQESMIGEESDIKSTATAHTTQRRKKMQGKWRRRKIRKYLGRRAGSNNGGERCDGCSFGY